MVAALAFFAFRPGKGWLRQAPARKGGAHGGPDLVDTFIKPGSMDTFITKGYGSKHPWLPSESSGTQQRSSGSAAAMLPPAAAAAAAAGQPARSWRAVEEGLPAGAADSMASDPLLSFIASSLAAKQRQPAPPAAAGAGQPPLPAEMERWTVQWEGLALERPIGRGSFGVVSASCK